MRQTKLRRPLKCKLWSATRRAQDKVIGPGLATDNKPKTQVFCATAQHPKAALPLALAVPALALVQVQWCLLQQLQRANELRIIASRSPT